MIPAKDTGQDRSSHSHHDYQKSFEKSILSPFPEDLTLASPYLHEAYRLEKEGAERNKIEELIEKARQADPDATSYYLGRLSIIKKNWPKYIKINPDEQT